MRINQEIQVKVWKLKVVWNYEWNYSLNFENKYPY